MNRRKFLKVAGLTIGLSIPALSGIWWLSNRGQDLLSIDPYAPEPWQTTSTSGPVLVIINEDPVHRFGRFLAEILWAEGLNGFTAIRLADASPGVLNKYACILVSAGNLTSAEVKMLADYATAGGKLVVFLPNNSLSAGLGLTPATGTIPSGSTVTNPQHPLAAGIVPSPLSIHVQAGLYPPDGADVVARLDDPEAHPAVFIRALGKGMVVAWAYDLAENIVLTRQGNPAMASGADYKPLQRPVDLFSSWIDFDRLQYPQADEQQRLLANIITWLCKDDLPLPRLWYFPGQARCLLVATSDSHRNTFSALDQITQLVEKYSGTITLNYTPPLPSDFGLLKVQGENLGAEMGLLPQPYFPTPGQFVELRTRGHEITLHPIITDIYVGSWSDYWNAFTRLNYGPITPVVRTHNLEWRGWAEAARIQAGFGYRMNMDYYQYGPLFLNDSNNWFYGHFTGSGLPMRFANDDGRILNIYQQVTQFGDESFLELPWVELPMGNGENTGSAQGIDLTTRFMQSSLDGFFSAMTINYHSDPYDLEDKWQQPAIDLLTGTLDAANKLGVPIWTAQRWLDFTTMRQKSRFETFRFQDNKIAFDLVSENSSKDGLSVLIPQANGQSGLHQVKVDGVVVPFEPWKVGGVGYGLVKLEPGSHHLEAEYS
jgi:hypothetical protein